jgi:hypothetical protein
MSKEATQILFPGIGLSGRFVGGSLTKGEPITSNGQPVKNTDGTPVLDYSFGMAIKKTPGRDWRAEPWGAAMVAVAARDFPQGQSLAPTFSWKITDGDSQIPNKKGKKPADNPNYNGAWVVWFSSRFPVKTVNADGSAPIPNEAIKPGHFIQVLGSVRGNTGDSPGVYVNHDFVAHAGFGPEITFQQDASQVGFGGVALPPEGSTMPVGGLTAPSEPATAAPPTPAAPIPTVPHTAPLDVPPAPGPVYKLGATAAVQGQTVEQVLAWPQWTPELLLQHGHLVRA